MFNNLNRKVQKFLADESGPTAVEYAIMLALIIVGSIAAVLTAGDFQQELWFEIADSVSTATDN